MDLIIATNTVSNSNYYMISRLFPLHMFMLLEVFAVYMFGPWNVWCLSP